MVILTDDNHEVDPFSVYTLDNLLFDIHANGLSESEIDKNPFLSTIRDNYPDEVAHAFELERDRVRSTNNGESEVVAEDDVEEVILFISEDQKK